MPSPLSGFLSIEDLADSQGELAISLDFNSDTQALSIEACAPLPQNTTQNDIAAAYLSLCNSDSPLFSNFFLSDTQNQSESRRVPPTYTFLNTRTPLAIYVGKKYKPVALKV